jgi:DNA-binding PadR family transcriptional regulator
LRRVYTQCILADVALGHALLGLLEAEPRHGYDLKRRYDEELAAERPMPFGQVYATLARLARDGLVDVFGVEEGKGPDRKVYVITPAGVAIFERWINEPVQPVPLVRNELFAKVVLALITGRDPGKVLDGQRAQHLRRMREVTESRRSEDLIGALACDHELAHLEADLTWIEGAGERISRERRAHP